MALLVVAIKITFLIIKMLARTLIRTVSRRATIRAQARSSFASIITRSSACGFSRSKRSKLSFCCNAKNALFTFKNIQKRFYSNDILKDAGWTEQTSKVIEKMDGNISFNVQNKKIDFVTTTYFHNFF